MKQLPFLASAILFLFVQSARAECNHGDLSKPYCDEDGDFVADTPKDPSQWLDPPTLNFTYTPLDKVNDYKKAWEGFLKYLQQKTGKPVRLSSETSTDAEVKAMAKGKLHIGAYNTGANPIAVTCAGFVPFAMMAAKDNSYGYEMEIIVSKSSAIQSPKDLKGKLIAFTSLTSNSGYKAPALILKREYQLDQGKDFKSFFTGKHDASILGVVEHRYDAAGIANDILKKMVARHEIKADDVRTIYKSGTFPSLSFGYVHNLAPDLQKRIREAFFTYNWEGTELKKYFNDSDKFVPISYKEHWAEVRSIDKALGMKYSCNHK